MPPLTASTCTHPLEVEASRRLEPVDITERVRDLVIGAGIVEGIVSIFSRHTTCGVLLNEYEDGLVEDLAGHLTRLVPAGYYAHDDLSRRTQNLQLEERANGEAHVRAMLLGITSQNIPIIDGDLALGRWQRVLFLELDEPHPRSLLVTIVGT